MFTNSRPETNTKKLPDPWSQSDLEFLHENFPVLPRILRWWPQEAATLRGTPSCPQGQASAGFRGSTPLHARSDTGVLSIQYPPHSSAQFLKAQFTRWVVTMGAALSGHFKRIVCFTLTTFQVRDYYYRGRNGLQEIEQLALDHRARTWQSQDSNSHC